MRLLVIAGVTIVLGVLALMMLTGPEFFADLGFSLGLGWLRYAQQIPGRITVTADAVWAPFALLVLAVAGLHRIFQWWLCNRDGTESAHWPWRRTLTIGGLMLVLFSAAICATAIAHQLGWLKAGASDVLSESQGVREFRKLYTLREALRAYAGEHGGAYPASLGELWPDYETVSSTFFSRRQPNEPLEAIIYFGGKRFDDPSNPIILLGPEHSDGKRSAFRTEGSWDDLILSEWHPLRPHAERTGEGKQR